MNKIALGLIGLFSFGLLASGCETDIPTDEIGSTLLNAGEYCVLSGGSYETDINRLTGEQESYCKCGGAKCGEGVNCVINEEGEPECAGVGFVFLTQGLCTLRGVQVCSDRIGKDGQQIGYWTECGQDNRWTEEKVCPGQYSCKIYLFGGFAMSSQCGDCQNNGTTCIAGKEAK